MKKLKATIYAASFQTLFFLLVITTANAENDIWNTLGNIQVLSGVQLESSQQIFKPQ